MYETIIVEHHDWGAALILNRPEKLNALSSTLVRELHTALHQLKDKKPKLVLIKGAGSSFSSGHDTSSSTTGESSNDAEEVLVKLQEITEFIVGFPAPVIASVSGYALGAGCEIALNCDLIYASEEAVFGFPELKVGLSITQGSSYFLPRAVGLAKAKELLLFSQNITAKEAMELRLVNDVYSKAQLDSIVEEKLTILSKNSSNALATIKKLFNAGIQSSLQESLKLEVIELKNLMG